MKRSAPAIIGILCIVALTASSFANPTVTIESTVHFTAPDGGDVPITAGIYQIEAAGKTGLRLVAADSNKDEVVQAIATTHEEALAAPVALALPDEAEPNLLHLVLLLPEGKGLDAAGSLTAVRPRGGSFAPLPPMQIQAALAQQHRIVPGQVAPQLGGLQLMVAPPTFFAVSYGGKCLDFGPPPQVNGAPVFLYGCNGTIAQQVVVQEVNARHEVILRAGTKVIGVKGGSAPPVLSRGVNPNLGGQLVQGQAFVLAAPEPPLELQDEQTRQTVLSSGAGQIFALDGDSMILAADRTKVVKVQSNRGKDRTPLVLGRRDLADAEFWTFVATDKSNRKPTSGFVRISQNDNLPDGGGELRARADFLHAVFGAKQGTVIELDPNVSLNLSYTPRLFIPAGVTIRGDRRGMRLGPELRGGYGPDGMLEIAGDEVRITGLRLHGPSRSLDEDTSEATGILAHDYYLRSIIDHNDMSDWPESAVRVRGEDEAEECNPRDHRAPRSRPRNVRVARNFLHHNQRWSSGYGVVVYYGAYPLIEGNTFVSNRHAIAGDGRFRSGYSAQFNLVLVATPNYSDHGAQQDFDMHGRGSAADSHYVGGIAGQYIEIARNTFLGANRLNFYLRGTPCYLAEFNYNISVGSLGDTIKNLAPQSKLTATGNQFKAPNPTTRLGVGDFDGNGRDDLFLATGAAWYYAPAGIAEWRFLNAQTDGIGSLLFGDFDADGRTDVFTQHGRDWLVSWAGASPWEKINESNPALSEFRIGDFIGDQRADVFYADGQRWWVSDGGVGMFTHTQDSSYRAANLGFGDFNGDGKNDVVGVVSGKWMVSLSATGSWAGFPLRAALTKTMAGLIVADFNGNGRADVATAYGKSVSYDGRGNWTQLPARPGMFAAVGRFDANPGADILFYWTNDNYLGIQSSGVAASQRHSTQHMR